MSSLFSKEEKIEIQSYAMVLGIIGIIIILLMAVPFFIKKVKGNQPIIDTAYDYDVAYIQLANGETVIVEIDTWQDSADGEQLTIVAKDGTVYLTSSVRCDLVKFPEEK